MKIEKALTLEKYGDTKRYSPVDGVIYEDLQNDTYCLTLYCVLEEEEDTQYPLEDILDKYYVNCTDYMEESEVDGKVYTLWKLRAALTKKRT